MPLYTPYTSDEMLPTGGVGPSGLSSTGEARTTESMESRLSEMIREQGYQFTAKQETCRLQLIKLGSPTPSSDPNNPTIDLPASTIARIIGLMVRTHTGLEDAPLGSNGGQGNWEKTWNMEIFVQVLRDLVPTLHWKEIIGELDHPGFVVKDRPGLVLLLRALKLGFQAQGFTGGFQGSFPVEMFYRLWKNTDAQVSLFQQILRHSDVFNFADYTHHSVAVELMKVQPDSDNRDVAHWKCLELMDTLLKLAEAGHARAVMDMFQQPKTLCPDVLTLGLIQINPPLTSFRT